MVMGKLEENLELVTFKLVFGLFVMCLVCQLSHWLDIWANYLFGKNF
jgi:hypothetical protein